MISQSAAFGQTRVSGEPARSAVGATNVSPAVHGVCDLRRRFRHAELITSCVLNFDVLYHPREDTVRPAVSVTLRSAVSLLALFLIGAAPAIAQRTETKDAGSGRKIVLHYNAANQIVENDTLGPNGELLEKNILEYKPGYYVPQSLNTSYWPNGKTHKITRATYDSNANFTGEFIQVFDEAGKQIGGHRLTHDPLTNVFSCAEWDTASQSYKARECPAGEEAEGGPETVKTFTQQEVDQQLAAARKNAAQTPPSNPAPAPSGPQGAISVREVGLVLPSHIRPGERVSGTVVENPADYENMGQVVVTRYALPFEASGKLSTLAGWAVEISGEPPQPADGPISLTIPPGQVAIAAMFRAADNVGAPVSHSIMIPRATRDKNAAVEWLAPATCVKNRLCMVHGEFTGNSKRTFAAFSNQPAKIIAETMTAIYLTIPPATDAGPRPLVVAEGSKAIAFPMVVSSVDVHPERRKLAQGDKMLVYLTLNGPEELAESEWRPGNFPPSNLDDARALVPGFKMPKAKKEDHDAKEKREAEEKAKGGKGEPDEDDQGGEILLVVKCTSPDGITFQQSSNGTYVFHIAHNGFKMGEFKYKILVDAAAKGGTFDIQTSVVPMLAPITGQVFPASDAK